jgi:O-antigen ligase
MAYAPDARSLGDLFSDLSRDIGTLFRHELALARAEMSAKISRAGRHAGTLALGVTVALAGLFTLAASLVLLLVRAGMPAWAAALLVGLGLAGAGAAVAVGAIKALRTEDLTPTETIQTLKETTAWKGQTN